LSYAGIPIRIPTGPVNLDKYRSTGQQDGEELLPETATASNKPSFDQAALDQLLAMGFPENRCKRAFINTGHNGAEVAMNWLFEHMEDPGIYLQSDIYIYDAPINSPHFTTSTVCTLGIDDPITEEGSAAAHEPLSVEKVELLVGMGFSQAHAKKALRETVSAMQNFPPVCVQ